MVMLKVALLVSGSPSLLHLYSVGGPPEVVPTIIKSGTSHKKSVRECINIVEMVLRMPPL